MKLRDKVFLTMLAFCYVMATKPEESNAILSAVVGLKTALLFIPAYLVIWVTHLKRTK